MADTELKSKMSDFLKAYHDLEEKMADPAIISDQKEYNRLAKEYSHQGDLAKLAKQYVSLMSDLEEAKEMLSDAEMKTFATEEISRIEPLLPDMEEQIKILLIEDVLQALVVCIYLTCSSIQIMSPNL